MAGLTLCSTPCLIKELSLPNSRKILATRAEHEIAFFPQLQHFFNDVDECHQKAFQIFTYNCTEMNVWINLQLMLVNYYLILI